MIYYRGESNDYGTTACTPTLLRNSKYSVLFEKRYYEDLQESFEGIAVFDKIKRDTEKADYYYLKLWGAFQHYGLKTRLLDITSNKDIALYFACSKNYAEDGILYTFDDKTMREIHTPDALSILRKIQCIRKADRLCNQNLDVFEELEVPNNAHKTITNNLIVDYELALKDVIGTKHDNLRLDKQHGAFIMFGLTVDDQNRLTNGYKPLVLNKQLIKASDKEKTLIRLAVKSDEPIYGVTVYPDSRTSIDIVAKYKELHLLKSMNSSIYEDEFNKYIDDQFKKYDELKILIKKDREILMKRQNFFGFLLYDFKEYTDANIGDSLSMYRMFIENVSK